MKGILKNLGFTSTAEKIYLTLLKKGPSSVSDLAVATGKYRPAIYKALPSLLTNNLIVKTTKGKRVLYQVESPAVLSAVLKGHTEKIVSALPSLIEAFNQQGEKPKFTFFEGARGIATLYEELVRPLPKGGVIYRYESPVDYSKNKRYYPPIYWQRAGSSGDIEKYVISNKKTVDKRRKNLNRFSKSVAVPFENNVTQLIAGSNVALIDYNTESGLLIGHPGLAAFQQVIFRLLFSKL